MNVINVHRTAEYFGMETPPMFRGRIYGCGVWISSFGDALPVGKLRDPVEILRGMGGPNFRF